MSKIRYFIIFMTLGILWSNPVNAQSSKLQQGIDHFMNGSYEKALVYFNQVIGQELASGPEQMVDACYYRGLTYIRLYNEAYSGDNEDAKNRYKDALLSAYIDFKASLGYDNGSKWKQIDLEIKNLHHALLSEGLSSLNAYNDKVYHGKPDPGLLKRAEDYLVAASEIRETYLVCDLLGQVYLDKGMKGEATDFFSRSERLYTENLPDEPDFLMAYVFYRQAALHKQDDIRLAMQDNQRGLKFMESEYARFSGMKGKLTPGRIQQMEEQ
ncbi:MAG: hypothetical protein MUC31_07435, partial [Bacteroidales bacterium]|nr:hypothetical protein [Bacteroidales bacterium]